MQPPPGLGLRSVEVAGPSGVIVRDERGEPVPCDPKRHFALLRGTFVVPDDGRDVLELQAIAVDQKGREGRATAQYFVSVPGTWTGRVTYAWADVPQNATAREFDVHNFRDGQADVTLREVPSPLVLDGRVVGEQIQLDETGTTVSEQSRQRGTIWSHVCDGEGTGKIARGSFHSRIVRKTEPVDLTGILGFDVPVGESYYWIWPDSTAIEPPTFHLRCQSGFEDDLSRFLFIIGNLQPGTVSPGLDPELRVLSDAGRRMQGTWTWREGPDSLTVTWDLVRSEPGG